MTLPLFSNRPAHSFIPSFIQRRGPVEINGYATQRHGLLLVPISLWMFLIKKNKIKRITVVLVSGAVPKILKSTWFSSAKDEWTGKVVYSVTIQPGQEYSANRWLYSQQAWYYNFLDVDQNVRSRHAQKQKVDSQPLQVKAKLTADSGQHTSSAPRTLLKEAGHWKSPMQWTTMCPLNDGTLHLLVE